MNKKLIAFFSILSLFLSTPIIPANAAAKAGAKCNKAGITSVASGKTFTCVKSGNKLVWNKGAKTKPTSTGKTASMSAGVKAALDDLDQYPKSKEAPQQIDFRFGPNADKPYSEKIVKNSNATMKFFVDFYQSSIPFPVVSSFSEDKDWAIAEMAKIGLKLRDWNEVNRRGIKMIDAGWDPVLGGDWKGDNFHLFYTKDQIKESGGLDSVHNQGYINHHIVHGIQNRITGDRDRYLGLWVREGGAEFYNWYILGRTYPELGDPSVGNVNYSVYRSDLTKPIRGWPAPTLNLLELNETQWFNFIKNWDCNTYKYPFPSNKNPCPIIEHQQLAYPTGAIMYERLVGEFSHKKVMDWWYEIRTTPDWEEAFAKTFKVNIDDWYKKSAIPYLMQVHRDWVHIPPK